MIIATEAPAGHRAEPMKDEDVPCSGCAYLIRDAQHRRSCGKQSAISCMPYKRRDRESVIFIKAA